MKIMEIKGEPFTVIRFDDKKKLFQDNKETCVRFIKGFDKGSPKYVDLRLIDLEGNEIKWH